MLLKIDTILADHPTTSGFYKLPRDAVDQMKQAAFAAGSLQKQLGDHFSTQDIYKLLIPLPKLICFCIL